MSTQINTTYYKSGDSNFTKSLVSVPELTTNSVSGPESKADFVYEYSDLNFLQTRVKVLSGEYAGLVLDYGGSYVVQWEDKNEFIFEHTIYAAPESLFFMDEKQSNEFKEFLKHLLCDVIEAKKKDPDESKKIMEALDKQNALVGSIKIDSKFYNR